MVEVIDMTSGRKRERSAFKFMALALFTLSGWLAVGLQAWKGHSDADQVAALQKQVAQLAQASAQNGTATAENNILRADRDAWRKRAGKAYTAFLRAQDREGAGVMPLPTGATFDCPADGTGTKHCDMSIVYPPKDF